EMMIGVPIRSGNTLRFPWVAPLDVQDVSVEYPRSLSGAKYIFVRKSVFFGYELKLLISTSGGRFPRAWLEPPCASHSGVSRLMLFPQMFSVGRVIADPGVAAFRSNQRCSASDYE